MERPRLYILQVWWLLEAGDMELLSLSWPAPELPKGSPALPVLWKQTAGFGWAFDLSQRGDSRVLLKCNRCTICTVHFKQSGSKHLKKKEKAPSCWHTFPFSLAAGGQTRCFLKGERPFSAHRGKRETDGKHSQMFPKGLLSTTSGKYDLRGSRSSGEPFPRFERWEWKGGWVGAFYQWCFCNYFSLS